MNNIYEFKIIARSVGLLSGLLLSSSLLAAQVAAPFTSSARYNIAGQLTATLLPDPDGVGPLGFPATRNTYNANGLVERTEAGELIAWQDETIAPASWSGFVVKNIKVFQYDQYGRKTIQAVLDQQERTKSLVQFNYDTKGRTKCRVVRLSAEGYLTSNFSALPDACIPNTSIYGGDRVTQYTYDNSDQILIEKRAVGTALAQAYVTNTYYPNTRLLKTQADANGNVTELAYDAYKRLYRRYYPSPTAAGVVNTSDYNEYRYDANGNRNYERKRNSKVINYGYDNNNRMTLKDLVDNTYSQDVYYDYDLRGLTLSSRFSSGSGQGVINVFNGFGNLASSTSTLGGISRQLSYQYDNNGNRERITHPDSTYFTYGFDGINRVNNVKENNADTLLTVVYGANGRRQSISRPGGATTTYQFDEALRLASFQQNFAGTANDLTNTFAYNPASQVTQLTLSNSLYHYQGNENRTGAYTPNRLNQYTHIAGQPIAHDTKGNLTNDGSLIYTYDDENRLVSTSGAATSAFTYDPLGRLFEVTVNGAKTQFLYDGDALVAEYVNGALARRYVHGDQVDEPWVQYNSSSIGASARRYLHADHQGSVIAHSNNIGTVLNALAYDSYGIPGSANIDRFGYTGQLWLKELGLFHYKARMYSPKLGRFLQTDPVGYEDQMNLYAYVGNDPMNLTDPTGKWLFVPWLLGLATTGGSTAVATTATTAAVSFTATEIAVGVVVGTGLAATTIAVNNESAEGSEGSGKSRNKPPEPLAEAEGNPHSIIEKPGKDGQYTTHNGDGTKKQYRGAGKDHGSVPRPNVKEYGTNTTPEGETFPDKGRVRPPESEEIPN